MYQPTTPQASVVKTLAARAASLRPQQAARIERAVDLVLQGAVLPIGDGVYRVESGSRRGLCYLVRAAEHGPWPCACPDHYYRKTHCAHGMAAKLYTRAVEVAPRYGPSGHRLRAQ